LTYIKKYKFQSIQVIVSLHEIDAIKIKVLILYSISYKASCEF